MTALFKMRIQLLCAVLAGLALRIFFVLAFPFSQADDTKLYEQLADNWLYHGVYGIWRAGQLAPVDIRVPGYPAFLGAIYSVFGEKQMAVLLAQTLLDLAGCIAIALLAARLAPRASRERVAIAGLWLAALCPFTANYAAAPLTETLATLLTTLILLAVVASETARTAGGVSSAGPARSEDAWLFLAGILAGLGTLVRPETPLVLIAAGLIFAARLLRPREWLRLARQAACLGVGLILPLLPWAARNWISLHRVQFLNPHYANLPDEYVAAGLRAWTRSWLWRFGDVYLVPWKVGEDRIYMDDLPASAFDSSEERERVAALLQQYNATLNLTPEIDGGFSALASERTRRHPLRTYLWVPLKRGAAMWFTPRVEMLPLSGHLWPVADSWEDDPVDFCVSLMFFALGVGYVGLALAGAWRCRQSPAMALLVAFILVRTAFLAQMETPEPRYVIECFPAVLALGAAAWSGPRDLRAGG